MQAFKKDFGYIVIKASLDLTITRFIAGTPEQTRPARSQLPVEATLVGLRVIQQLRGQKGGEGGQSKVHACPLRRGGGESLECPRGPKPCYCRKHFIPLFNVIGVKEIKLHCIKSS